jgi:ubiquitin-protein ligase
MTRLDPEHPNIHFDVAYDGVSNVCLNILTENGWRYDYTIMTVVECLKWLLLTPHYHLFQSTPNMPLKEIRGKFYDTIFVVPKD